jgi:hypothetical protein
VRDRKVSAFLGIALLVTTACNSAAPPSAATASSTSAPASTAPAAGSSPTVAAAASPPASPAVAGSPGAAPSPVAAERVDGVVRTAADGRVTLETGRAFAVPPSARVLRRMTIASSDLKVGDYVALTARRQPDNTLLASIVNVFPPSMGQVAPGQRPMTEGNLMTNATIDQIQGNSFTVAFTGGGARVQLAPDARVTRLVDASLADVRAGNAVSAQVANDAATSLTVESNERP